MSVTLPDASTAASGITAGTVLDDVRRMLNDEDGIRFPNTVLLRYVEDAQRDMLERRPDIFLGTDLAMDDAVTVSGTSTSLPLTRKWLKPLSNFACFRALDEESADTANAQRAQAFYTQYLLDIGVGQRTKKG